MRLLERTVSELKVTPSESVAAYRAFKDARAAWRTNYGGHHSHAVVAGLEAAGAVLRDAGFFHCGVAGFCGQSFEGGRLEDSVCDYLNTGDAYRVTLLYDYITNRLVVGCWADIHEAYGRICQRRMEYWV